MYRRKNFNVLMIAVATLSLVIIVSLVYAGFTGQLNITGTAVQRTSNWDIHFENLSNITTTGSAKVLSQPALDGTTTIEDYSVSTTSPGDTISFTFKVVNDGNYNASISSVSVGTPECTGTDTTSNTNVCGKLTYTLTYENGATVQTGDMLYAKDYAVMKVTLTYADFSDASLLPTADVSISGLGITINYQQSGSALVKDNGEVANYTIYHIGDKVTLNNEDYWVIANSGVGQDYVVALKNNVLTSGEINTYGSSIPVSATTSGGVQYGSTTTYETSYIKLILDEWILDKFSNSELKEVEGYQARLITRDEYNSILSYSWRGCGYTYWTMILSSDSLYVFVVARWGLDSQFPHGSYAIRPVINIYKSALETNNNAE